MYRLEPRTLTNKELINYSIDMLQENGILGYQEAMELLRRFNFYTVDKEDINVSTTDPRQQELPL